MRKSSKLAPLNSAEEVKGSIPSGASNFMFRRPRPNLDKYHKAKAQIKEIQEKLDGLGDSPIEVARSLHLIEKLGQISSEWVDLFNWTHPIFERIDKERSFEKGNNVGFKITPSTKNCPYCGLTPLRDQFCSTCGKYVVFTHKGAFPEVLEVTDELIITKDYQAVTTG